MTSPAALLEVAKAAAAAGAAVLAGRNAEALQASNKGDAGDWVTAFDVAAEHAVRDVIAAARPGDAITGATVNAGGRLVVRAARVGADTALAQIARLVTDAQNGKAQVQRLADRVSGVFVPVVLLLSAATLAGWLLTGHSATKVVPSRW